jgi:glycosyltransferase involved in cell wall biosynthesis
MVVVAATQSQNSDNPANNTVTFTILITTYNRRELLERSIDSSLAQTLACEVVVVDDCSSDDTESWMGQRIAALHQVGDQRLVYHRNATNQGHSQSVNTGVNLATGKWIKFLDDDDYLAPHCIAEMVQAIGQCPQAVICSAQAAQVDLAGNEQSRTSRWGPGQAFYIPQADIHYGMLMEQVPFGTPVQVAVQREAFLQTGGWQSNLDTNFDDIQSWSSVVRFGDAVFINQCLAYRTLWPGAFNQKFSLRQRMETHRSIKSQIYHWVDDSHRKTLPPLARVNAYLQLHWGLVALKQKRWAESWRLAFPALFSPLAWALLFKIRWLRSRYQSPSNLIRQKVITP